MRKLQHVVLISLSHILYHRIIIQDIKFEPIFGSLTEHDAVVAALHLNDEALGETDVASRETTSNIWRPSGAFSLYSSFLSHLTELFFDRTAFLAR